MVYIPVDSKGRLVFCCHNLLDKHAEKDRDDICQLFWRQLVSFLASLSGVLMTSARVCCVNSSQLAVRILFFLSVKLGNDGCFHIHHVH